MEEAKKDAKLQKAIRTANKKIINDAKIEARKVDMIDSNKSVTRKSSRKKVPNTQLINYDTS